MTNAPVSFNSRCCGIPFALGHLLAQDSNHREKALPSNTAHTQKEC